METPREIMFRAFSDWGISNKELASLLVRRDSATKGKSPIEQIETRSSLSRFVVHVQPGDYVYGWFEPFEQSVPRVTARLKRQVSSSLTNDDIVRDFVAIAADMRASLDSYRLDGALYANAQDRFVRLLDANPADAVEVSATLLIVTGCTGDPRSAVNAAVEKANRYAGASALRTTLPQTAKSVKTQPLLELGVYRCENGVLLSNSYRLSTDPQGTEIGSLSTAPHSINDVGIGVSRRHARVWRDAEGQWWIEGLRSTNGTVHVNGVDGTKTIVEPPRGQQAGFASRPVRLLPGDRIVLAGSTEFAVVALPAR